MIRALAEQGIVPVRGRKVNEPPGDLGRASDAVARAILDIQSRIPAPVVALLDHEPHSISIIIGILKAGCFYVPFDLTSPPLPLSSIVADTEASLIVTGSGGMATLAGESLSDCQIVAIHRLDPNHARAFERPPVKSVDLAAAFYTSGSTGRPKGVTRTHEAILQASWAREFSTGWAC